MAPTVDSGVVGFPEHGTAPDDLIDTLRALQGGDVAWREGRVFTLVYDAGPEVHDVAERAFELFLHENALNTQAFPSIARIQRDVLTAVADLLHGGEQAAGFTTSGGTESLLMAVKAARDWGRAERGITEPEMVLPTSAHAAFAKASHYFDVKSVRVDVDESWRADVDAMASAVTSNTVLLVGSAPGYPQGVVDPIPEIAAIARERGTLCHVDACMGGFLLPFLERLGRFDAPWDFRVEGVTSISADIHKYGYAPKGVSTVTYASRELRKYQAFTTDDWLGGFYGSPSMPGTRPAGPLAAAWAVINFLGADGYLRLTEQADDAARVIRAGVMAIDGLAVVGDPDATLLAITGDMDVFALGEELFRRGGWFLDRQSPPDSLHATVHAGHARVVDAFVNDLAASAKEVAGRAATDRDTTYGTVE
jgi:glutamate/tyrosine decarboxylase-like PLP-dependent enzyme